jgi:hypothetical protein
MIDQQTTLESLHQELQTDSETRDAFIAACAIDSMFWCTHDLEARDDQ